jgi:hypothetical protein
LAHEFGRLLAPILGQDAAMDLFHRTGERYGAEAGLKLAYTAAFFLGEFDKQTMDLNAGDWDDIRETLKDASGEMDINVLSGLMGELLSLGEL